MLQLIDTLFNRGLRIVDMGISRIIGINGVEPKINGKYPSINRHVQYCQGSKSSIWLLCKLNQLQHTDFNDIEQVKDLVAGMYITKEGELEYSPQEDMFTMVVFTYTKTINGTLTKERVKLWLVNNLDNTQEKPKSESASTNVVVESGDDLVL